MARAAAPGMLLALLGGPGAAIADAASADWATIDALAALHRLQPRLSALHRDNPAVPSALREGWHAAYRQSALIALTQQADLADCVGLLADAGIAAIALKGAWLARFAYPHPAERPLRDIDLLTAPDQAIAAWRLFARAGYREAYPFEATLEQSLAEFRHLPALVSPRGTWIELHHRLNQPDDRAAASQTGESAEQRMWRRAIERDGIRYPATDDLIEHLVVHAAYSHRLDCGPLVLSDLALAADRDPLEPQAFWRRARSGGWVPGAALLIALSRRYHGPSALPEPPRDIAVPPDPVLAAAAALLLQDPASRLHAETLGDALNQGPGALARRFARVRGMTGGSFIGWAADRIARGSPRLLDPAFREQARDHARVGDWLRG